MNNLNWTHKKALRPKSARLSINESGFTDPLNQIGRYRRSNAVHSNATGTIRKPHLDQSPVKSDRLMPDRWWLNYARFIKKVAISRMRLRPAHKVKTDLVDTIGAGHGYQGIGEMFLIMNLLILSVFINESCCKRGYTPTTGNRREELADLNRCETINQPTGDADLTGRVDKNILQTG